MPEVQVTNKIHGYSLFTDVEDKELQRLNRARILANIIEDNQHPDTKKVTVYCKELIETYWENIEEEERRIIYSLLDVELTKRAANGRI